MNTIHKFARSNALGLIAIFIALGGVAWAATAPRNSVVSKSIKNGQVKSPDIATGGVASSDIKTGQVRQADLAAPEPWIELGDDDFQNDWENGGDAAEYSNAAYYKDPYGVVHLKGIIKGDTAESVVFQLPEAYRPTETQIFSVAEETSQPDISHVYVRGVTSTNGVPGDVSVKVSGTDPAFVSLDGITFRAD